MAVCNLERIIHILKTSDYSCINKKKSFFFLLFNKHFKKEEKQI